MATEHESYLTRRLTVEVPGVREFQQRYERAAVRWVGRFALEAKTATLEDVQAALCGLAGVAMGFPGALEELANLLPRVRHTADLAGRPNR